MLSTIRRHAYSWTIRAMLILLAVVFTFWGVGTGFFARVHAVASVDGQNILAKDVDREVQRIGKSMQNLYGANAAAMLKALNVRQMAVERLINQILAEREASKIGILIGNAELQQAIASQSAFEVGGHFDFQAYRQVLHDNELTPAEFENATRGELLVDALRQMVTDTVQVSDEEARRQFDLQNSQLSLAYTEVPYASFVSNIYPTEKQIAEFYKENQEAFREPDRIKIVFVRYDPLKMAGNREPTESEITDFYNSNRDTRFSHPEQVYVRHILIRVAPGATDKEKANAKATAEEVLRRLKAGADFAQLAGQYSDDDATRLKGGALGLFARGELLKPLEDVAFKLKAGESAIVETKAGYHIIRVDEIRPEHSETMAEARPEIIKELKSGAGAELAHQALNLDLAATLEGKDLKSLAEKHGLAAIETPFFSQDEMARVLGDDEDVGKQALKLDAGEARAVTGGKVSYLVKLVARQPAHIPPLKEVRDLVRETLVRITAESEAREAAQRILKQIKGGSDFDKVAVAGTLPIRSTGPFPQASRTVPGIGEFPEVAAAAALVPQVPGVIDRVLENGGNAYVFEVLSRIPPKDEQWKAAAPAFKKQLLQARRTQAWVNFLNALKDRAQIVVHPELIGQQPAETPM